MLIYLRQQILIWYNVGIVNEKYLNRNLVFRKSISIGIYVAEKEHIISENILDVFDKIITVAKNNICENEVCVLSDKDILDRHYLNKLELELCRCVHSHLFLF